MTLRTRLCLLALVTLTPSTASAELGEWGLTLGAGAIGVDAEALTVAPSFSSALRYGVSDFWLVGATLDVGPAIGDGIDGAFGLVGAELAYALDIVTWVPRLSIGVGALAALGDASRVDLALSAGGGLEYRADRDWSLLFSGRYHFLPTADASAFSFALGVTLYFE